jgi:hypothetical protein
MAGAILVFHTHLKKKAPKAQPAELSSPDRLPEGWKPDNEWRSDGTQES